MPSPIGHALGGIAVAWWAVPRRTRYAALGLAATALVPDLDLLVGDHRGISHSVGAAVIAGVTAAALWSAFAASRLRRDTLRVALCTTLAWGSHIVLDWLSNDTRPPLGVMALWPITSEYFKASIEIFPAVSRQCCGRRFWLYNLRALIVEGLILAPLILLALRSLKRK